MNSPMNRTRFQLVRPMLHRALLGVALIAFLAGADQPPALSLLWRPDEKSTLDELLKAAREAEDSYWQELKQTGNPTQAQVEFDTASTTYSYLFEYLGHYDSLRRAVALYRKADADGRFAGKHMAGNPDDTLECTVTEITDSKEPLFRDKYRVFVVWIKNDTGHDIELSGLHLRITDVKGAVHENVDLRSDPALWEKVKTTPHMWDTRLVLKNVEGLGKGAVAKFSAPIASVAVDLEKEGVIEVPYLQNLYGDL